MVAIIRRPEALRDLEDIFVYIGNDNLEAAHRFQQAAESAFQFIAKHPGIGRERRFKAAPDLRSWRIRDFENYLIFFRPQEDSVEIIRVLHGALDLEKEFESDS